MLFVPVFGAFIFSHSSTSFLQACLRQGPSAVLFENRCQPIAADCRDCRFTTPKSHHDLIFISSSHWLKLLYCAALCAWCLCFLIGIRSMASPAGARKRAVPAGCATEGESDEGAQNVTGKRTRRGRGRPRGDGNKENNGKKQKLATKPATAKNEHTESATPKRLFPSVVADDDGDELPPLQASDEGSEITDAELEALCTHQRLWLTTYPTLAHRLPGVTGVRLWALLLRVYARSRNARFPLYVEDVDGYNSHLPASQKTRLHFRSDLNDRNEQASKDDYKSGIKSNGFCEVLRNKIVLTPYVEPFHPLARRILAAGHCIDALYEADIEVGQTNAQVRTSVELGFNDVIDLRDNVPDDVQVEFVNGMNTYNVGSGFNMQQLANQRLKLQTRWHEYKFAMGISSGTVGGTAGLEAVHRQWLSNESKCKVFSRDWVWYDKFGIFLNSLTNAKMHAEWCDLVASEYDNKNSSVCLRTVCMNMYHADLVVKTNYFSSLPTHRYNQFWKEAIRAVMPTVQVQDGSTKITPYHRHPLVEVDALKTKGLAASMDNGKQVPLKLSGGGGGGNTKRKGQGDCNNKGAKKQKLAKKGRQEAEAVAAKVARELGSYVARLARLG